MLFLLEIALEKINIIYYILGENFLNSKKFLPLTFFYYFQLLCFIAITNIFIRKHYFKYILYIIIVIIIFFAYAINFSITPQDYLITKNYLVVVLNILMIFLLKNKKN